jgi:uncharacterized membrane protein (DUF485 family)
MAGMDSPTSNAPSASSSASTARDLATLAREKSAISTRLLAVVLASYFGFIGLLAFAPDLLSAKVGNATLGIPLGMGVIVLAWLLTGVYVRWANSRYDSLVAQVRSQIQRPSAGEE